MSVSTLFYQNVSLLLKQVTPSEEFKKHFRENMFDKPNTAGFLYTSHYLLTIYDSERFKKLIEWPVTCKKTEAQYRNNVKSFLIIISAENRDINFPNILVSHLFHASGSKFVTIMWKLSQAVLRKYITSSSICSVMLVPQAKIDANLGKQFLKKTSAMISFNILNHYKTLLEMEEIAETFLKNEEQNLNNIKTEIFEREQVIKLLINDVPVHSTIQKHLIDINDKEVIQKWKENINEYLNYIQNKNKILKNIEQVSHKVNNIVSSNSGDIKMLDAKQFQQINYLDMSKLFPYDIQSLLFQLYTNDKLNFHNFILLFNSVITQLHQPLKLNTLANLSEHQLQIETSCKDMKEFLNIFQTYLLDIRTITLETGQHLCHILHQNNIAQIYNEMEVPTTNNVLLMSSPLIKIDTNCTDIEIDQLKHLQLTPVEGVHKSLFSRYEHLKPNNITLRSRLRENLLVSHITFDDSVSTTDNEKVSLHVPVLNKSNLLSSKQAEKYSRLFSMRTKRNNNAANTSVMSIPCTSKANSTAIASAIEEIHDMSELSLNISEKNICNNSVGFTTPLKLTTTKDDNFEYMSEIEDVVNTLQRKPDVLNICETIEIESASNQDKIIIKSNKIAEATQRRRSISDLVERYKKLLEGNNHTNREINCVKNDNE
ncbi:uncharacterized protein LOC116429895 [Nomia melanderi]|uniref:uncharacterized protein LOC116429895 n=1 Tax=Nomia melanderi TaxID=2448451 RepID=UPI0013043147|nr:uncharacterized protein LOC116429895 [Nomia melanderi]